MVQHEYTTFETQNGFVALAWNQHGVSSLRLPSKTEASAEAAILKRLPEARRAVPVPSIATLIADIKRYFAGDRVDFSHVPVDLGLQEPFFARVYAEIRKLGWGETTTYGTVARTLGAEPRAARDVGQAMANNPVPLIVPCHRVLAAGRKIGGFSAPGGSGSKARMLEIEGADVTAEEARQSEKAAKEQLGFRF